ncbi:MAG: pilus assembly protein [Planctomycetes bacterium]|nr:pilus assembly protein [Planctomycetota bacterium]
MRRRQSSRLRQGTTALETAVVLPVFLFMVYAIIAFAHAQMVNNMLNSACRNGARVGSVEGTSTSQVLAQIDSTMGAVISPGSVEVSVKDASIYDSGTPPTDGVGLDALPSLELSDAEPRQMFLVRARLPYNEVALIPMSFMDGVVLEGNSFMRHE